MKKIIVCIGLSVSLSSCLDHLLEPDKPEKSEERVYKKKSESTQKVDESVYNAKRENSQKVEESQILENSTVPIQDNIPQLEEEAGGYGSIIVENLRLRENPTLEGEIITLLKKNSFVTVKEVTTYTTTVELNGNEVTDVWYRVISEEGKIGWVHGCCIDVTWP